MSEESGSKQRQTRASVGGAVHAVTKGKRGPAIIVAIVMIVLGILFLVVPLITTAVFMYLATIGLVVYGVYQIVTYFQMPDSLRNGWKLANGILFIIIGVMLLFSSAPNMVMMFSFLLGFLVMYTGINRISISMAVKRAGDPGWGWILASGIINLILSIFFLVTPFMTAYVMDFILGFYLIVGGVSLLFEAFSGHSGTSI